MLKREGELIRLIIFIQHLKRFEIIPKSLKRVGIDGSIKNKLRGYDQTTKKSVVAGLEDVDFVIMGSDGIWEEKSHQDLVKWVQDQMKKGLSDEAILEQLLDETVSIQNPQNSRTSNKSRHGYDNMTAILIKPDPRR